MVFESAEGIEGLRCSGFAETFSFEASTTGLSATPTLSILTNVTQQTEAVVQLSYLSHGFDRAADYVADRAGSGGEINLGGWITLANGNGMSFPNARVQIVAGSINRESGDVEPIDFGRPIYAQCWPRGSTTDYEPPIQLAQPMPAPMMAYAERDVVVVTGSKRAEVVQDLAFAVKWHRCTH